MAREYDAIIVGAGQAGVPLAKSLAAAGWHTALVERKHVGGTCVNEGCTPTKTMVASARVAYLARRAKDYGIDTGDVSVDMAAVRQRKRDIVQSWQEGSRQSLESTENLDLLMGEAAFTGLRTLEVRPTETPGSEAGTFTIKADRVFINTGCRPATPSLPGLDQVPYLDSTTIMELGEAPRHLLILGGGYVAVEFAQMFRRFGSQVTLVQRRPTLLPREDSDVAEALAAILREDGVELVLEAEALSVARNASGDLELQVQTPSGARALNGSHLLTATGRVPNTEALDLAATGLEADARGYVPVNERLETRVDGIYALGDVNGGPAFTHISYDDYRVIRANLLEGGHATTTGRVVPYVVYCDPELGRVGMSEREARDHGHDVRVYTMPMTSIGRALEMDEARGMVKAVVDSHTDLILGCAVLGVQGGEIMSAMQMAMMGGLTASQLREVVFAHPTLAEGLNNLFAR